MLHALCQTFLPGENLRTRLVWVATELLGMEPEGYDMTVNCTDDSIREETCTMGMPLCPSPAWCLWSC